MSVDIGSMIVSIMGLILQCWNLLDTFELFYSLTITDILLGFLCIEATIDFFTGLLEE